jgi:hypothetical protein
MWQGMMFGCWALALGAGPPHKAPKPSASTTAMARFLVYSIIDPPPQKADPGPTTFVTGSPYVSRSPRPAGTSSPSRSAAADC